MTNRSSGTSDTGMRFEQLCRKLLEQEGYIISSAYERVRLHEHPDGQGVFVDLYGESPDTGRDFLAEIKFYLTVPPMRASLFEALNQIRHQVRFFSGPKNDVDGILMTNVPPSIGFLNKAKQEKIDIWGLDRILSVASNNEDLQNELKSILDHQIHLPHRGDSPPSTLLDDALPPDIGSGLIKKLGLIPPGNDGWQDFETTCDEAVRYLFSPKLHYWKSQHEIEGGFHRPDLIARIDGVDGVWSLLSHDHRTRFIIFEFKNSNKPITQEQIYSTEKYLFPNALRSIAIIVAREGSDDGAKRAIQAALRGAGKLILVFDLNELMAMLQKKEDGKDPSDGIVAKAYEMLTDLAP